MIDSHCHLNCLNLEQGLGIKELLMSEDSRALKGCLCVGLRYDTFDSMVETVGKLRNIWFSVGNHPNEIFEVEPQQEDWLHFAKRKDVIAIGETGLDFHYEYVTRKIQAQRFAKHIEVAKALNKPLIIHCRDSFPEVYDVLANAQPVKFVMHCFTGTWAQASDFLSLGGRISFSGVVTFKNAKDNQYAASMVPLEQMFIETDSPYLAPVPYRGKSNQPGYVRYVAEKIAELKGCTVAEVTRQTTKNFEAFFGVECDERPFQEG